MMRKTILVLAANPKDTSRLRLDHEVREIDERLQIAKRREDFSLKQVWAPRPKDIRRAMLDYNPNIVHFCGHGSGEDGIAFEDDAGNIKWVDAEALAGFFQLFADKVECVVLNACYSEVQAKAIARHIRYVIGMKSAIGDSAAIEFAAAFYDALGAGESVDFAYKLACNALIWTGVPERFAPALVTFSAEHFIPTESVTSLEMIEPELYCDFDLHIAPDGHVTANSSQGQATSNISIQVPNAMWLALNLIEKRQTDTALLKQVGQALYDWLFPGPIHTHFHQTEAVARAEANKVRLRLRIEAESIASLPLEFIYRSIGGYFLAVNPDTVFSRYLNLPLPSERVRRREGALHMLAIVADPIDQTRLNPDEWEALIQDALAKPLSTGEMTLQMVKRATRKEIRNALLKQKPDIIQFVGHGIYQGDKGYLALVDENTGKTWLVDDERFANLYMGFDDRLGLINLATCESAKSEDPQGFLGIAPQLVQRGIPAVVAMQYKVYIKTAKVFLEDFYASVAARKPIDWAAQSARNAISLEFGLDNREFATPVLYMRAEDGNVF